MTSINARKSSNHLVLLLLFFDFHSKRCTRSSWRTATCTSNTSAIYPWSPFLWTRRADWPACAATGTDASAKSAQTIFKDWLHKKRAMWNIPHPYLPFSQAVSPLIGHELWMIRLRRTWHHEIVSECFSCRPFQKLIAEAETDNAAVGNWHHKPRILWDHFAMMWGYSH